MAAENRQGGFLGMEERRTTVVNLADVAQALPLELGFVSENLAPSVIKRLEIDTLNTIVQARDEHAGTSLLTASIKKSRHVIHTPFAVELTPDQAQDYLSFVQQLFERKVKERKTVADLVPYGEGDSRLYYIVVSGHRRIRALREMGETYIDVKIAADMQPLEALYLQAQENTGKPLKDYERAEEHGTFWAVAKVKDTNLTLKEFSESVGTPVNIIRRDLRYYDLPREIKEYVVPRGRIESEEHDTIIPNQPLMPFNVACQLGRLVEVRAPLHEILFVARRFFEENVTSEKVASDRVGKYIKELKTGAVDMMDIFGNNAQEITERRKQRQVAERFSSKVDDANAFFARVVQSQKMGFADSEEDGVSYKGAATRLLALAETVKQLLPGMESTLSEKQREKIAQVFEMLKDTSMKVENITCGDISETE